MGEKEILVGWYDKDKKMGKNIFKVLMLKFEYKIYINLVFEVIVTLRALRLIIVW